MAVQNPNQLDHYVVRQFKCSRCGCQNTYEENSQASDRILANGFGLFRDTWTRICRMTQCYCHTGVGRPVKIATRTIDYGEDDVPF